MKTTNNQVKYVDKGESIYSCLSINQIILGGNYFGLPRTRGFIVWDKGEGFKNRTYAECEYAWTSFDCNAKIFKHDPLAKGDYRGKINPCQKPVKLYKWLLTHYAKQGDKILDTHLGSGSSRIAAHDLGFDFYGYELDLDYYNSQEKRFKQHISQVKLFDANTLPEVFCQPQCGKDDINIKDSPIDLLF